MTIGTPIISEVRPRFKPGNWKVTRFCCSSGLCSECHARGNHGDRAKRARVVQTDMVSRKWAEWVAMHWPLYEAKAEPMP